MTFSSDRCSYSSCYDGTVARSARFCRRLAAEYDATYVDFLSQADLRSSDFRDLTHLLYPGQEKYQRELAQALAPITRAIAPPTLR